MRRERPLSDATRVLRAEHDAFANFGIPNPPVFRASTVLFRTLDLFEKASREPDVGVFYGRRGTPTTFAFQDTVADLEGAEGCVVAPSGTAAIALSLLALVGSGDHVLVTDGCYTRTRALCGTLLARMGVETTFYDPTVGSAVSRLFRSNTRLLYLESPSSITFEMQDVPAIAAAARSAGIRVVMDNTWASPLLFRPLSHGVDAVVHSATKHLVGHSDAMLGVVSGSGPAWPRIRSLALDLGQCAGPDDLYLAQRGLRTLHLRLRQQQATALALARWLARRPEVAAVRYPALPGGPGHEIWKRDYSGAAGLFGLELRPCTWEALAAMVDHLDLLSLGYSWGGYEPLLAVYDLSKERPAGKPSVGPYLRIYVGLAAWEDLRDDLAAGFDRLGRVSSPSHG